MQYSVIADVQLYMLVAVNWPVFRGYHGLNWATDIRWLIRLDNMEPFVVYNSHGRPHRRPRVVHCF